jgi:hypothetical protein
MLDVVVLFFVLGVCARLVKSDLRLPEALYETLSIFLLLAIGLKGGIELSKQPLGMLAPQIAVCLGLGFAIPFLLVPVLRRMGLNAIDSAALAAHYGSVSVVTFAVASAWLKARNIDAEAHAALWVALMEAPGLVAGILLARLGQKKQSNKEAIPVRWRELAHDVFLGKSVLLLAGGLAIGAFMGEAGTASIKPVFIDLFKGVLALFLLELGWVAAGRLSEFRRHGLGLFVFALAAPVALAWLGILAAWALGLSLGGMTIMGVLAASASYIAAPTAMRIALPEANAALSITAALGITFPFNLVVGIPLYYRFAQMLP